MYAIIEFKGTQLKVEKDQTIRVPFLKEYEVGAEIEINRVLLLNSDKDTVIGTPTVKNSKVIAEIVKHGKDKKVIVFKKKRRKGYEKKQGHRQNFTQIKIKDIIN
ncbi:MAG: 50S ribosomal protein L21 [Candidatus Cloacimonas sp. 4484_143]|nr:MAG: 50S ribosomal protein L21 [Candidatus Cloacimonas sp. 4484_143]RLC49814.1 MAG: 50S ribosomal protein L21 [Candidatus Cloacimonadota bacterium]RLC54248.1 MAG: 50S ribosomal protein L21 [Candidatus Cloacimonadota bacterium]